MSKRRRFTPEFKAEVVFEVLSGSSSEVSEVCRRHNLNENQLSQWKRQVLENAPSLFGATDKQSSEVSENRSLRSLCVVSLLGSRNLSVILSSR